MRKKLACLMTLTALAATLGHADTTTNIGARTYAEGTNAINATLIQLNEFIAQSFEFTETGSFYAFDVELGFGSGNVGLNYDFAWTVLTLDANGFPATMVDSGQFSLTGNDVSQPTPIHFDLNIPFTVSAGDRYAIALTKIFEPQIAFFLWAVGEQGTSANPYPDGTAFRDVAGSNWGEIDPQQDFRLTAHVRRDNCEGFTLVEAGEQDGFAGSQENSFPSPEMRNLRDFINFGQIPGQNFVPANAAFGHTLTFPDLAQSDCGQCEIVGATLELGLRATSGLGAGQAFNDTIALELVGNTFMWASQISNLTTTGWGSGQSATITLDLGSLPVPPLDILSSLNDGDLDVLVQDDTGVDYLHLRITTECDCTEIHGTKFYDANENGIWDAGEQGLSGWTIELRDAEGFLVATTISDPEGNYWFMDLAPATYSVSEVGQPEWHLTFPPDGQHSVTVLPGEVRENVNFGNSDMWCGTQFQNWGSVIFAQAGNPTSGTNGRELIIGTDGPDEIEGEGGDDCIYGLGGDDNLHGDKTGLSPSISGADEIHGGQGNDTINGDAGGDTIYGDGGNDYCKGDSGDDTIFGGPGRDKLKGDSGRDKLRGGPDNDFLKGDSGGDKLSGEGGDDRLCGNSGGDFLDGGSHVSGDECRGGGGSGNVSNCEDSLRSNECTTSAFDSFPL